jgi:hypothetical protein
MNVGVLDPANFSSDGGPSIAERLHKGAGKTMFRRGDNKRVASKGAMGGWDQLRGRMEGEAPDRPMIVFFSNCIDTIRTLPALQHDKDRIEDCDSAGEDHSPDSVRYACMSRPWIRPNHTLESAKYELDQTINELIKKQRSKRLSRE